MPQSASRRQPRRASGPASGPLAGIVCVLAVIAAACGGDDSAPPTAPDTTPTRIASEAPAATPAPTAAEPADAEPGATEPDSTVSITTTVDEIEMDAPVASAAFDPATTPPLGDFDVERLAAAAATLDPEAECPDTVVPESLEGVAEVLRIAGGCDVIEYVQLDGRTLREMRAELFASDETVHAVGLPPRDLFLAALQTPPYGDPPSPYDEDEYGSGDWWHLAVLDAARLWEPDGWRYSTSRSGDLRVPGWGGGEVIVAVIDSGTADHRDLRNSLVGVAACHRSDTTGHGTHVAGLIAAARGNGQDVAGIAPNAKIRPIVVSSLRLVAWGECQNVTATQAVKMAREHGADVINMSFAWGEYGSPLECEMEPASERCVPGTDTFEAQLRLAQLVDIVAVGASGNCGDVPAGATVPGCPWGRNGRIYPAAYPGVLVVAATGPDNQRAAFSTSNEDVDIAAPGELILSTVPVSTCRHSTTVEGSDLWEHQGCGLDNPPSVCPAGTPQRASIFDKPGRCAHAVMRYSGTSYAAPLVSGVVAHMKARYPRASHEQMITALLDTADPPGLRYDPDYGHGLIQPKAALEALDQVFNAPPRAVSAGGVHSCMLRTSGIVECWGQVRQSDVPSGEFSAVSAGGFHTCGLRTHDTSKYGAIVCWSNPGGSGSRIRDVPPAWFSAVSSGARHSCGVLAVGTIHCWGDNSDGQLDAPSGEFTAVSAGHNHSCGLNNGGAIKCWGGWGFGESDAPPGKFIEVSAGQLHSCGLRTDRTIECWGSIDAGTLDVPSGEFIEVSAGRLHSCGLRTDGTIECWGSDSDGQSDAPAGRFISVSAGEDHSCGIRADGAIECWGSNIVGQSAAPELSDDSSAEPDDSGADAESTNPAAPDVEVPDVVPVPEGHFTALSSGDNHACGSRPDGTVECWGRNYAQQLKVPEGTYSAVSAGSNHSCGIRTDATVVCWGNYSEGPLPAPEGEFIAITSDTQAFNRNWYSCGIRVDNSLICWGNTGLIYAQELNDPEHPPEGEYSAASAGFLRICAVHTDSSIVCWNDIEEWADVPQDEYSHVSSGTNHECGLRTDATVICWGYEQEPFVVEGTFRMIDSGSHSCGLRTDGTILCWGSNHAGQLDDVPDGTFSTISVGLEHSCGLRPEGTVICWGRF